MRCTLESDQTAELVIAYGAGTLDPDATAAFERHMQCCHACREAGTMQRVVWAALDQWRDVVVSAVMDRARALEFR
jgi:anti-sigma factor RsiW